MIAGPHLLRAYGKQLSRFIDGLPLDLPQVKHLKAGIGNLSAKGGQRIVNGLDRLLSLADFRRLGIVRRQIGRDLRAHGFGLLAHGLAEDVIGLVPNDRIQPGVELSAARFELEFGKRAKQLRPDILCTVFRVDRCCCWNLPL